MITPLVSSNSSYYKAKENICPLRKDLLISVPLPLVFHFMKFKKTGIN
jgi:hypothetical protein